MDQYHFLELFSNKWAMDRSLPRTSRTGIQLNAPSKLACFPFLGRAPMLVYVRPSNEALLRARVPGAHRPTCVPSQSFSSSTFTLHSEWKTSPQAGGWGAPSLRASSDHRFIVGALRARRMVQLLATFFSARPSTPSPPSPSSALRPWPVPAPSQRRGAAAERFRQRSSCALHLF